MSMTYSLYQGHENQGQVQHIATYTHFDEINLADIVEFFIVDEVLKDSKSCSNDVLLHECGYTMTEILQRVNDFSKNSFKSYEDQIDFDDFAENVPGLMKLTDQNSLILIRSEAGSLKKQDIFGDNFFRGTIIELYNFVRVIQAGPNPSNKCGDYGDHGDCRGCFGCTDCCDCTYANNYDDDHDFDDSNDD